MNKNEIKTFHEAILYEQNDQIENKLIAINDMIYSQGCNRERRINGYASYPDSSRKFRFVKNPEKSNFKLEIVNKGDESFVAEIGNIKDKSVNEIVDIIKDY